MFFNLKNIRKTDRTFLFISQQYIHTEDYRYNDGDARGHIAIDNHDLYQQGNKLNRIGNQHYRYDNAGRLIEKTDIQDGFRQKTTYYRWNGNNQLESLTNEWGEVWYYKYDALGRRIEKACPQRNTKTTYLWDGDQVAYQETERHNTLESQRHNVFNGWELIAQQDSYFKTDLRNHHKTWTQATNYAVCQPNGQPLALFNPQGKRTWRKAPSSLWGLPLLESWESKQAEPLNPNLLFAGQYFDQESGLAYNRFRYYNPQSGCYLKSDPIGLAGGETPYAYVHNPMGWVDPFGLAKCPSEILSNNLGNRPNNSAAHHIIPEGAARAKPARDILDKHKIDYNDAVNGVFLPNKNNTDGLAGILHNGRHPNEYIDEINRRIISADKLGGKQGVIDELANIKDILGNTPRNADWRTVLL